MTSPINWVFNFDTIFKPSSFFSLLNVQSMTNHLISSMTIYSLSLCVILVGLEMINLYIRPVQVKFRIFQTFVITGLVAYMCSTPSNYSLFFRSGVMGSVEVVSDAIRHITISQAVTGYFQGIQQAINNNDYSLFSIGATIMELPLILTIEVVLQIIMILVIPYMNCYLSVMTIILYCFGPLFLPLFIYRPTSGIAWNWFRTYLAYMIACPLCLIAQHFVIASGFVTLAIQHGQNGQMNSAIVASVVSIGMFLVIPSTAIKLMGGTSANPMAIAIMALEAAVAIATSGASSAAAAAIKTGSKTASKISTGSKVVSASKATVNAASKASQVSKAMQSENAEG